MISPGDFIPLFESNGLIRKIDNYVWNKTAEQIRYWKDKFGFSLPVSVNVSRIDIFDPYLLNKLGKILEDNSLSEEDLMLEITESAYSENADTLTEVTENLRASGFMIEMDDFGSGYSSLNMITTIPIDVLKLDMKFIRNMENDDRSMKLVELIIDIARFLDVTVVAEGVETKSQFDLLKCMGCQVIQGYYFSKTVPADEFEAFILKEIS
jgi:EAL domain-containing protein (putative c-di-GMP-specific phosphodiesterase class I)